MSCRPLRFQLNLPSNLGAEIQYLKPVERRFKKAIKGCYDNVLKAALQKGLETIEEAETKLQAAFTQKAKRRDSVVAF